MSSHSDFWTKLYILDQKAEKPIRISWVRQSIFIFKKIDTIERIGSFSYSGIHRTNVLLVCIAFLCESALHNSENVWNIWYNYRQFVKLII